MIHDKLATGHPTFVKLTGELVDDVSSEADVIRCEYGDLLLRRYMDLLGDERLWATEAPCNNIHHEAGASLS